MFTWLKRLFTRKPQECKCGCYTREEEARGRVIRAVVLQIHEELKCDTEFWFSGGRTEGGGNTILNSVKAMVGGIPSFTLKELNWTAWPQFRDIVRKMHRVHARTSRKRRRMVV